MTPRRAWRLLRNTVIDFVESDAPMLSAATSFYAMLALSPLLIIAISIISPIYGSERFRQSLSKRVAEQVGAESAKLIDSLFMRLMDLPGGTLATVIGIVLILYATTRLFVHLQDSLNKLWGVPRQEADSLAEGVRKFLYNRLMSAFVLLIVGILVTTALAFPAIQATLQNLLGIELPGGQGAGRWLNGLATYAVLTIAVAILYKLLPDVPIQWRDCWIGANLTAALLVGAQALIGVYFSYVDPGSAYGAAGALFVLLLWMYYQAQVFFLGAHFTHRYAMLYGSSRELLQKAAPLPALHDEEGRFSSPPPSGRSWESSRPPPPPIADQPKSSVRSPIAAPRRAPQAEEAEAPVEATATTPKGPSHAGGADATATPMSPGSTGKPSENAECDDGAEASSGKPSKTSAASDSEHSAAE